MTNYTIPYVGLRPFRREETALFFGRDTHTDALLEKLGHTHFLAVLAPSGYGKSSLVRTGLLAGLDSGYLIAAGARWCIADLRPEDHPLVNLVTALLMPDVLDKTYLVDAGLSPEARHAWLMQQLQEGPYSVHQLWQDAQAQLPEGSRLLILVDQFEELFRYYQQGSATAMGEVLAFVALLLASSAHSDIYIVITMRSDFIGDCAQFQGLSEAINQGLYLVPRLSRAQLREAIALPARVCEGELEETLVNQLLNDIGNATDQLPLLQHALLRMWLLAQAEVRADSPLPLGEGPGVRATLVTMLHYDQVGGVQRALHNHAQSLYDGLNSEQQRLAEILFRSLTTLENQQNQQNQRATRRPVALREVAELAGVTWAAVAVVVEVFRQAGCSFLMPPVGVELSQQSKLDISHESLIRQWQTLQQWLQAEAEAAKLYRELESSAEEWQKTGEGLWQGVKLARAQEWQELLQKQFGGLAGWARRYGEHFELASQFLAASVTAQQRAKSRQRLLVVSVMVFLSMIAWVFYVQKQEAEQQTQTALRTQSLFLADLARQAVEKDHPFTAMRLALEALPGTSKVNPQRPFVQEATQSLFDAINRQYSGILEHDESVSGAVFQPKGNLLLTYAGNKAYLWDMPSRQLRATLSGHTENILDAAFSPDGQRVVTASRDKTARLWEGATGRELAVLKGHESYVLSAAFSPDGQRVVTASWDNTARLWEGATGRQLAVLKGHQELVTSAAFSPDGQRVVTASWDNTARLWEGATGRELAVLKGHQDSVYSAAFSPDGQRVVTASYDKTARLWEGATGRELAVLTGHESVVTSAAFSPDGQRVVTASWDKTARLWEGATGRELAVLKGHESDVNSAAFSPDGQRVVTASGDNTARLWEGATGRELAVLKGHQELVTSAAFSPDGQRVVTASADKTARLWEGATGQELAVLKGHENSVNSAAFSPDGQRVVTASGDNTARLWEGATGRELAVLTGHEHYVNSAAFSPDGQRVVTASDDKTARLWEGATGRELAVLTGHNDWVNSAAFSPDGQRVVTASSDKTARLWEGATGRELAVLKGHEDRVTSAAFSPDGQRVVTASRDNTARLWEGATGRELAVLTGHQYFVNSAAFSPDGLRVVTASSDNTARLWEGATGRQLAVLKGHENTVTAAAFSPDGQRVVTASYDKTARLWEGATGRELAVLKGHENTVTAAAFSPDGQRVVTASDDNTARLWLVFANWQEMVAYAQRMLPRTQLTCEERRRFFLLGEGEVCRGSEGRRLSAR